MTKHPTSKYDRLILNEKKKKRKEERDAKVWRKLTIEQAKEQESEDEIRTFLEGDHDRDQP